MRKLPSLLIILLIAAGAANWSCSTHENSVTDLSGEMEVEDFRQGPIFEEEKELEKEEVKEEKVADEESLGEALIAEIREDAVERPAPSLGLGAIEMRHRAYEKKRGRWQALERQMTALGFENRPRGWYRCLQEAQSLSDFYKEWQEEQKGEDGARSMALLFQRDIGYLESGCVEVMGLGSELFGGWLGKFAGSLTVDSSLAIKVSQGEVERLKMARELLSGLPERRMEPEVRRLFALSLVRSGNFEAAANILAGMTDGCSWRGDDVWLRQLVADLFLATGQVDRASQCYGAMVGFLADLHTADRWSAEQLSILESEETQSEAFSVFLSVLRSYLLFDGHNVLAAMRKGVHRLEVMAPESSLARRGHQLLADAEEKVREWVVSRLDVVDGLVEMQEYDNALKILAELEGLEGLDEEPRGLVKEALEKVKLIQSLERETRRMLQEQELAIQWENGLSLLDLQQYDEAIEAFSGLLDTGYHGQAREKIIAASNMAAKQLRLQSSNLFVQARKANDPERKRTMLQESWELLRSIGEKYPDAAIMEKVRQNLIYLEEYIGRFDPALLETPQKGEDNAEVEEQDFEEEVL